MEEMKEGLKPLSVTYVADMPYKYHAGYYYSRFLRELRDNKKIVGVKCPKCGGIMEKGRLYSYSSTGWNQTPIYWAEIGSTSWKSRELVNVSEEATAYLCRNCWIIVLYETGDNESREPETEFAKALREDKRGNKP